MMRYALGLGEIEKGLFLNYGIVMDDKKVRAISLNVTEDKPWIDEIYKEMRNSFGVVHYDKRLELDLDSLSLEDILIPYRNRGQECKELGFIKKVLDTLKGSVSKESYTKLSRCIQEVIEKENIINKNKIITEMNDYLECSFIPKIVNDFEGIKEETINPIELFNKLIRANNDVNKVISENEKKEKMVKDEIVGLLNQIFLTEEDEVSNTVNGRSLEEQLEFMKIQTENEEGKTLEEIFNNNDVVVAELKGDEVIKFIRSLKNVGINSQPSIRRE